jgi:hypothetical protein
LSDTLCRNRDFAAICLNSQKWEHSGVSQLELHTIHMRSLLCCILCWLVFVFFRFECIVKRETNITLHYFSHIFVNYSPCRNLFEIWRIAAVRLSLHASRRK